MADGVVRLDSGQVRQIMEARRSGERLQAQLQRMDAGGGGGIGSGILDRLARFETFANRVVQSGMVVTRAAERLERFLALSGLSNRFVSAVARESSSVQGIGGGANAAAPVGVVATAFAQPVLGPLAPVLGGLITVSGALTGAYYGSEVPKRRLEGDRRVLEIQNEQVRADAALKRQVQEFTAKRAADRVVAQTSAQLQAAFRRVRRGAVR